MFKLACKCFKLELDVAKIVYVIAILVLVLS